ncbi:ATP-dependent zinc metalloprotease FtsH [Candidatus Fokinia solitaria]|uniref:ATP-dependent zinc metalloprotease FtsH n=1 Tax=Candidatus Fokinia solitaria TaxID=1802984 RepID=A0A2U8BSS6_9RICK|nr:ATP-dependent zinc metalloprotease FtsH [Candidatus Fokinia solitaria]AWD33416.1 ATP-dependent zinc metalloprotease FtsH [Candidatus Fokinia solitaria]
MFDLKKRKSLLTWCLIVGMLVALYGIFVDSVVSVKKVGFSDFMELLNKNHLKTVTIRGSIVEANDSSGTTISTLVPELYISMALVNTLLEKGVKVLFTPLETPLGGFLGVLLSWVPGLLLLGMWSYYMRTMQGGGKVMSFSKSRAQLVTDGHKVTFADVAGVDEAKAELEEIVLFLKNAEKFKALGARIPRGCLLVGPPGTGKTLLAKAIAGEASVPFFNVSGSDFVEMFVGIGAGRVRDMFKQAKEKAPCLLFIDEIDAVGRKRGSGHGGGNDEREQTLNQLLVEMDGFGNVPSAPTVIVLAATNRPDVLDQALLRPGRFDRQVVVSAPDIRGREQILKIHMQNVPIAGDVDIKAIARSTPGFTGADLSNLINEAILYTVRCGKNKVEMYCIEYARDKVMMGPERKSIGMTEHERRVTAYHEAGHSVVALHSPASDALYKVTIMPRGYSLGATARLPEHDKYLETKEKMLADIAVGMGGREAERLIFGEEQITTGASGDIVMVTKIAKRMVIDFGMSERIGHVKVQEQESYYRNCSEEISKIADEEVKAIIEGARMVAQRILREHKDELELIANALLKYETLTVEEVKMIVKGEKIRNNDES